VLGLVLLMLVAIAFRDLREYCPWLMRRHRNAFFLLFSSPEISEGLHFDR
jgi:hypothetical protein